MWFINSTGLLDERNIQPHESDRDKYERSHGEIGWDVIRQEQAEDLDSLRRPFHEFAGDSLARKTFLLPSFDTGLGVFLLSS